MQAEMHLGGGGAAFPGRRDESAAQRTVRWAEEVFSIKRMDFLRPTNFVLLSQTNAFEQTVAVFLKFIIFVRAFSPIVVIWH